jgi:hypothetical protein
MSSNKPHCKRNEKFWTKYLQGKKNRKRPAMMAHTCSPRLFRKQRSEGSQFKGSLNKKLGEMASQQMSQVWLHVSVIPARWRIVSLGKNVRPYLENNLKQNRAGGVAQAGECLPRKHKNRQQINKIKERPLFNSL